jgi:hypothetical protein
MTFQFGLDHTVMTVQSGLDHIDLIVQSGLVDLVLTVLKFDLVPIVLEQIVQFDLPVLSVGQVDPVEQILMTDQFGLKYLIGLIDRVVGQFVFLVLFQMIVGLTFNYQSLKGIYTEMTVLIIISFFV